MALKAEMLDELVAHGLGKSGQWMLSEKGLMGKLRRALAERLFRAELTHHLAQGSSVRICEKLSRSGAQEFFLASRCTLTNRLQPWVSLQQ